MTKSAYTPGEVFKVRDFFSFKSFDRFLRQFRPLGIPNLFTMQGIYIERNRIDLLISFIITTKLAEKKTANRGPSLDLAVGRGATVPFLPYYATLNKSTLKEFIKVSRKQIRMKK